MEHSLRGPFFRMGQSDNLSPLVKIGNNFKGFRNFSASISGKDSADLSIDSSDFGIIDWLWVYFFELVLKLLFPCLFAHGFVIETQKVENVDLLLVGRLVEIFLWCHQIDIFLFSLLILLSFCRYILFFQCDFCFSLGLNDLFNMRDSFVSLLLFGQNLTFTMVSRCCFRSFWYGHVFEMMHQQLRS